MTQAKRPGTSTPVKTAAAADLTSAGQRFHGAIFSALEALDEMGDLPETSAACQHLLNASYLVNGLTAPKAARDVAPGESWAFSGHRSQQEVILSANSRRNVRS
jgi:hypothetical protein